MEEWSQYTCISSLLQNLRYKFEEKFYKLISIAIEEEMNKKNELYENCREVKPTLT
jgi:hypothetical protein